MHRTHGWTKRKPRSAMRSALRSIFYKPVELRPMDEILKSLNDLEQEADGLLAGIMEGVQ